MSSLINGIFASARRRAYFALLLAVAVGLTEGITLLLLLPLLQLAGVAVEGSVGGLSSALAAIFGRAGIPRTLFAVLLVYVVITVIQASLVRAKAIVDAKAVHDYATALRTRLYSAVARAEWLVLSRIRSSDVTFALTTAVDRAENGASNVLHFIASSFIALVYIGLAMRVSPQMTAIVLGAAVILLMLERARTALGLDRGERVATTTRELYATAAEQLGGLKTSKSYGQEERHLALFLETGRQVNAARLALTRAFASLRWRTTVGSVLALSLILYLAVGVMRLPTAAILLLLFIFSRLVPRLVNLQQTFQEILSTVPALAAIESLIVECERHPEKIEAAELSLALRERIELREVSFSYGESTEPQLSSVSIEIPAGKTTAIVGASGAGKTTIADVLLGLIQPTAGSVVVDGTVLDRAHLQSWRSQIGYVGQDTFLFNDTVRANLLWASPDANDEGILKALDNSRSMEFVSGLPNGIDTVIGERGVRLSGGERQRLSLARALLRNPRLLVLDEATSALDSDNEERIYSAIHQLHGEMTIVVITHRLSTIRNADMIHVLDWGILRDSGSWDSLVSSGALRIPASIGGPGI